ncbi:MAG: peptidase M14 [Proteobacteria bacterium]|nr:peptidase M14 [Pseudomonadota bacterium]
MTILIDTTFPRTLDRLVADLSARKPRAPVEAWVFEDEVARRAAEATLAGEDVRVTIRSAYKPLLCFFLKEVDRARLRAVTIRYPRHPEAHPDRFLAEAYPLAALLEGLAVTFEPGHEPLTYAVTLTDAEGETTDYRVFAPNILRDGVLANSGWMRMAGEAGAAMPTEFEALFLTAVETVRQQQWTDRIGTYDRLTVTVQMPGADREVGWGDEVISFREAMHEDLFFTLREMLVGADVAGTPPDRMARPGQIIPDIRPTDGAARLRITGAMFDSATETEAASVALEAADRPLGMAQIRAALGGLGGAPFAARSGEGREVAGIYRAGPGPAVLITAGQHANETSGVVGGLRAAQILARDPQAHFAYVPVENVDGYELHQRLIVQNPRHMHHAARFTALGDDVSPAASAPDHERLARYEGIARSGAKLHINLHGYPAHEWTRPLSGYLPKGFEAWSMPKGFFLIVVHYPGWGDAARALLERVSAKLAEEPEIVEFNARQMAAMGTHGAEPVQVMNGIPYYVSEAATYATPLTVITEAPDETVYGTAFMLQQKTQMRAALACVEAYRAISAAS